MITFPPTVTAQFDGRNLPEKTDLSALLSTVDADDWPHLSFLSVGEVLIGQEAVALMLWTQARSTEALAARQRGILFAAGDGIVHEIRLEVARIVRPPDSSTAIILARPDALRAHNAPYAQVSRLISFSLDDPANVIVRWERQIAAMRRALENGFEEI